MNLSLSEFFDFLFHEKESNVDDVKISKFIFASTLNKMRFIAVVFGLMEIVALCASFLPQHADKPYVTEYRYIYAALLLIMVFSLVMMFYAKLDMERRYTWLERIVPASALAVLAWAIIAMCVNAYALGFVNPSLYIAVLLVIPICTYMNPVAYLLVGGFLNIAMLVVYYNLKIHVPAPAPKTIVIAVILLFEMVIALILYFLQYSIRVKTGTYEAQKKEISDLSNAQNRFFSSMSHEIRTPINTIIGLNEMILREKVSDEVAEDAANIRAASNMLLHLINDILDMSKISSGQMKLTPVSYHPGDMLSEIVGMLWLRAREKGLEFNVELAPDIPSELFGDEVRIKQILINVLNNAIKYTQKGSVVLSIQCNGIEKGVAEIVYSVKDTGMGIRKESIPHLFTAFKRVDEEENRYIEGTGLGLSIVKELTELMGGRVTVNSVYTQGSTFVVTIPQTVVDYTAISGVEFEEKHRVRNESGKYRASFEAPDANILAVDDNESNLLVISKLLRDTKANVETVQSGAAALEKTLEKSYDVILMDHLMPEMDGIECFRRIRNQTGGASKNAKVVILTANAGSDMKKLYSDEGFDGYLVKPIDSRQLENELMIQLPGDLVNVIHSDDDIIESSMLWIDERRKKRPIAITTESVADIPGALLKDNNIMVISHKVETENGIFADGLEIDSDGVLDYMKAGHNVKTHAPSVMEHEKFYANVLSGANNILHLTISSKVRHSGYDKAKEGASAFDNVAVFDTRHLSSGQGLLVLKACQLASTGISVGEMINRLTYLRKCIHTSFIVDNLDYLAQSGQVSPRLAAVAKSMMFHPVIDMNNGKMTTYRFYFGSKAHAWSRYISSTLSNVSEIDRSVLFITYVGLSKKDLDRIKELVERKVKFERVYCQKAAPAIAVNSGPGTFGLLFADKE